MCLDLQVRFKPYEHVIADAVITLLSATDLQAPRGDIWASVLVGGTVDRIACTSVDGNTHTWRTHHNLEFHASDDTVKFKVGFA